jgi:hypothetical protein
MSTLAEEVVWMAAKLIKSNRRAKPSMDLSTPLASLISHINRSFCELAVMRKITDNTWSDKPAYHPNRPRAPPSSQIVPQPKVG